MNKKRVFFSVILLFIVATFNYFFFKKLPLHLLLLIANFKEQTLETKILTLSFFIQWFLVFLIIFIGFIRHLRNKKIQRMVSKTPLPEKKVSSKIINTEMDNFYELLKIDKKMTISSIAAKFKIQKEIALEWAKILENQNLATIEYPAFGEPRVKEYISEKDTKEKEETNEKEKRDLRKKGKIKDGEKKGKIKDGEKKGKKEKSG